ncbi:hypothetical protein ABZ446_14860 [Streptomyces sp. NPDC005813]|uniref:hypothetical protein n=1 Tax=Streptomyces sp. NPDC005813 TaxID=3155592 RepID=UPI0033F2F0DE
MIFTAEAANARHGPGTLGRRRVDATDVRRAFRQALKEAEGIAADDRTPRELRHSFVSLSSDRGVPLKEISRLVGDSCTAVTEKAHRKQIRPVIQTRAVVMDGIFKRDPGRWSGRWTCTQKQLRQVLA